MAPKMGRLRESWACMPIMSHCFMVLINAMLECRGKCELPVHLVRLCGAGRWT